MTTYKSEQIEFRAGRIKLTEAEWTANTNVYPEGIIAITSDGSNAGNTKVFNGTSYCCIVVSTPPEDSTVMPEPLTTDT